MQAYHIHTFSSQPNTNTNTKYQFVKRGLQIVQGANKMSETDVKQSTRYRGALRSRRRWTVTPSLNCTPSGTSSQWRSACFKQDRSQSNVRVQLTRQAAVFDQPVCDELWRTPHTMIALWNRHWPLDRVQTHAGHSIAWNTFLHFVTL